MKKIFAIALIGLCMSMYMMIACNIHTTTKDFRAGHIVEEVENGYATSRVNIEE